MKTVFNSACLIHFILIKAERVELVLYTLKTLKQYIFYSLLWPVMVAHLRVFFLNGLFLPAMTLGSAFFFFFLEQLHNVLLWQLQSGHAAQMHLHGCLPSRTTSGLLQLQFFDTNCPISVRGSKASPLHFVSLSVCLLHSSLAFFKLLCFFLSFSISPLLP